MSFKKLLEDVDIKEDLKIPFHHLILKAFYQCEKLRLDNNLNNLQLRITTEVETSLNCSKYEVGAHFRYAEIGDNRFLAEMAIPKQINSLLELYFVAHEVGHFLSGHLDYFIQGKEVPSKDPIDVEAEAEADQWALQFFYDMGLERTKEIEEAIRNNITKYSKPGEKRQINFEIK